MTDHREQHTHPDSPQEREREARDAQLEAALIFLERRGYRRCDIPACNCGSWHGGHASERLREIDEALAECGIERQTASEARTILQRVNIALAQRSASQAELAAVREDAVIGKLVREKMTSGNSVPVERCTITRAELTAIDAERAARKETE